MSSLYKLPLSTSKNDATSVGDKIRGKVALIVNTASNCGLTPHYKGLQALQDKYAEENFTVLAYPCNQFGGQEPGSDKEIQSFVCERFKGTFPLSKKVDVNGVNEDQVWKLLKSQQKGFITNSIKWNFTKFLIDKEGNAVRRYAPTVSPKSISKDIETLLAGKPLSPSTSIWLRLFVLLLLSPLILHFVMFRGDEIFSGVINHPSGPVYSVAILASVVAVIYAALKKPFLVLPFLFVLKVQIDEIGYLPHFSREHLVANRPQAFAGKTALITGGNSGVGFGAATTLSLLGADVTLACRSSKRCAEAADSIRVATGRMPKTVELDLADYGSVAKLAGGGELPKHLDYLFNNAGFATMPSNSSGLTKEGLELGLGSMHFGHYYLTRELQLGGIVDSKTRVVTTSSAAALFGKFDNTLFTSPLGEGDLRGEKTTASQFKMYTRAKLANYLFTRKLYENGTPACSMHIGAVATSIWDVPDVVLFGKNYKDTIQGAVDAYAGAIMRNLEVGSRGIIRCALDETTVGFGDYLDGIGGRRSDAQLPKYMVDKQLRDRIWEVSEMFWLTNKARASGGN